MVAFYGIVSNSCGTSLWISKCLTTIAGAMSSQFLHICAFNLASDLVSNTLEFVVIERCRLGKSPARPGGANGRPIAEPTLQSRQYSIASLLHFKAGFHSRWRCWRVV